MQTLSMALAAFCMVAACSGRQARARLGFESVDFPAAGDIEVRADLYEPNDPSETLILLFHQAGSSRGEYREIAPKLVEAGYRVMAIDQRSGKESNGVRNETARRAAQKGRPSAYLDAYADLQAALAYARRVLKAKRVVAWGSSYSASLVFRLAAEHPDEVDAVLAFSPGEYFEKDKGSGYVRGLAKRVKSPLFVTSSKSERPQIQAIFDASPSDEKVLFTPRSKGQHGSRALWSSSPDNEAYWAAVRAFLEAHAPATRPK
jgi:dienelactone hydrolase